MGYKTGLDGILYASADLHMTAPPTFTEIDLVESIEQEHTRDEIELKNRRGDHTLYGVGKATMSYTVRVTYDPADAGFNILYDAFLAKSTIGVAIMDGDITEVGVKGWFADMIVTQGPKPEDLSAFDGVEFVLKPSAASTYEPSRETISA